MVAAIGIPSAMTDGNDVEKTFQSASDAVSFVRNGHGPFFLELTTYRWREHCGPHFDNHLGYRSEEEFRQWKEKDPIQNFEKAVVERGEVTYLDIENMDKELIDEVNQAFEYVEQCPFPLEETAYHNLYANDEFAT